MSAHLIVFWNILHGTKGWDNLSLLPQYKGQPSMKPYYRGYNAPPGGPVDGYLEEERGQSTCSITWTNPSIKEAWWKFPLKSIANVAYLEIYFRSSTPNRHVGFSVFIFNNSSYIPPVNPSQHKVFSHNISTCIEHVTNVPINKETQGIALYNTRDPLVNTTCEGFDPRFATIEICEVKVMGCPSQHFGENCTLCDKKCRSRMCDAFNGSCTYGCENKFMEWPECSVCKEGLFGQDCESHCGQCIIGTFCDRVTGICPDGCQDPWNGSLCNVCKEGYYGQTCKDACGNCRNGTFCNPTTGICPDGCEEHWDGLTCKECKNGNYGQNCDFNCGRCTNGTFCDNITGICTEGCEDHWNGTLCNVCLDGFYGHHCKNKCGLCLTRMLCNKLTGVCPTGCKDNWTGPRCDECEDYKYGPNCVFNCGHCKDGKPCSKLNGHCEAGCVSGWGGLFCSKESSCTENLNADSGISKASTAIISIVSTFVVVTLLYAVVARIVYDKMKHMIPLTGKNPKDIISGKLDDHLVDTNIDPTYQKITKQSENSFYQELRIYKNDDFVQNK
ncbi:scavenger receptor class F member 1-like [Saccostrea cucullata]|uniref:scavenger receptor class F member 1-like n=1 Tax=Saccostrea cuccullata TaxID=36930 RepID=UPI002ED6BFB7